MKKFIKNETFIFFGILISGGTLLKIIGKVNINSDWFWFLAGITITVEGMINLFKQKQFDEKYKIILRKKN